MQKQRQHDGSLSLVGTSGTSINSEVNQDFRAQTSSLSEMIWSFKNYPYVSKLPTIKYNWGSSVVIRNALILNNMYTIFNLKFRYYTRPSYYVIGNQQSTLSQYILTNPIQLVLGLHSIQFISSLPIIVPSDIAFLFSNCAHLYPIRISLDR